MSFCCFPGEYWQKLLWHEFKRGFNTWSFSSLFLCTSRSFNHRITAAVAEKETQFFPSAFCDVISSQILWHWNFCSSYGFQCWNTFSVFLNTSELILVTWKLVDQELIFSVPNPNLEPKRLFMFVWLFSKFWLRESLGNEKLTQVVPHSPGFWRVAASVKWRRRNCVNINHSQLIVWLPSALWQHCLSDAKHFSKRIMPQSKSRTLYSVVLCKMWRFLMKCLFTSCSYKSAILVKPHCYQLLKSWHGSLRATLRAQLVPYSGLFGCTLGQNATAPFSLRHLIHDMNSFVSTQKWSCSDCRTVQGVVNTSSQIKP